MSTHQLQYDTLLSHYSNPLKAIGLLREYRPYFELIPSLRRPSDSLIAIPLPVVKYTSSNLSQSHVQMQCDLALIMCDPDWKVKTGREIFVFIHRPNEDYSALLQRWRQVEVALGEEYYWLLPWKHRSIISDRGEYHYPLFVTLDYSPTRIIKGLEGASLPHVRALTPEIETPPDTEENQEDPIYDPTQ
ncbi:MAG: hypothetical protein DCF19_17990 [Pseudanabaena frigida]|uniref:Uncharacterized protein n=1 Tax=Pseudanabaena frigida TaxID=945775 RepID=A0A2W4Y349_9CYAN|nr:MAG: hypothetical protein DCF19_17990 [Pseudanabaena frigida]